MSRGASSGTALSGGKEIVASYSSATGTTVGSGGVLLLSGGTGSGTIVGAGGEEIVSSPGWAVSTTFSPVALPLCTDWLAARSSAVAR